MTSQVNSHRTTDIKPEMLSGVQTGNGTPHDKYNKRGIAHAQTNKKDDICMQRRLVQTLLIGRLITDNRVLGRYTSFYDPAISVLVSVSYIIGKSIQA